MKEKTMHTTEEEELFKRQSLGLERAGTSRIERDPWIHRAKEMLCKTCMYFVAKQAVDLKSPTLGRCRRHAPTMGGYPVVYMTDWCGDHKLDENKL